MRDGIVVTSRVNDLKGEKNKRFQSGHNVFQDKTE